jgi:hypothetical protein
LCVPARCAKMTMNMHRKLLNLQHFMASERSSHRFRQNFAIQPGMPVRAEGIAKFPVLCLPGGFPRRRPRVLCECLGYGIA